MKQKKRAQKKKSILYEILSLKKLPWNYNWLKYALLTALMVGMVSVPRAYAEGTSEMDSGAPSYDDSSVAPAMEFELGVIQDIEGDGTLVLTNGKRIKVSESLLKNPALHLQREILIYIKGGVPHVDREGRIVGAVVLLNSPDGGSAPLEGFERESKAGDYSIAYAMAARSTVTPPLASAQWTASSPVANGNIVADSFFSTSDGTISGSALLSGIPDHNEQN